MNRRQGEAREVNSVLEVNDLYEALKVEFGLDLNARIILYETKERRPKDWEAIKRFVRLCKTEREAIAAKVADKPGKRYNLA